MCRRVFETLVVHAESARIYVRKWFKLLEFSFKELRKL